MIFLICQDWPNTSNNHAGIKFLCKELSARYPDCYSLCCIPDFYQKFGGNIFVRYLRKLIVDIKYKLYVNKLCIYLERKLETGDHVFLMEYMESLYPQILISEYIKTKRPDIQIYAMIHLVPKILKTRFSKKTFSRWIEPISKVITLGHSLTEYLISEGVESKNVITSFHYVDIDYYHKKFPIVNKEKLTIIAMGNQMRNISLLNEIVKACPHVKFMICQGLNDLTSIFGKYDNVELIRFVPEDKLKEYMENADISLNVMVDTIGSNVIVTSLAMGLAMVCSDVGSIHDYCDENNTIFCDNQELSSFYEAIKWYDDNRRNLLQMKCNAANSARKLTIDKFHHFIMKHTNGK